MYNVCTIYICAPPGKTLRPHCRDYCPFPHHLWLEAVMTHFLPPECLHHGGIREILQLCTQSKYINCMYNVCTVYIHITYTMSYICTVYVHCLYIVHTHDIHYVMCMYSVYKSHGLSPWHAMVCHIDMQEFGVIVSWHRKWNQNAIVWTRNRGCQLSSENPDILTCT